MAQNRTTAMGILTQIESTRQGLKNNEITIDQAQADARLFTVQVKTVSLMLEHAKLTERLSKGDSNLPDFSLGDE